MRREQLNKTIDVAQSALGAIGFECIEVEWNQHDELLRIYIDGPNGIDMDACVRANAILADLPLLEGRDSGDYRLEVSSPGVERPLRRIQDFNASLGERVFVRFTSPQHGQKSIEGVLAEVGCA